MDKGIESASVIHFSNKQFTYELNFGKKIQKNLDQRYRTKREIRRRPVFSRLIFSYKVSSFFETFECNISAFKFIEMIKFI